MTTPWMRKTDPPLIPQPVFMLFGKQLGANCSTEKLKYAQGFCVAELWPTPPLYTNRCGSAHQAISLLTARSPTARNVLIKYSLRMSHLGCCCFVFFALHCFGLGNMGRGGVGWTLDFRLRRLVFGGFDRHVGILCCFLLAPGPTHCHGSCLNSEAPLSCSQECAAEKTREPSIKRAGCCESIGWNLHGLSHGFSVIFLHSEKTKWYVTVAEPNNG